MLAVCVGTAAPGSAQEDPPTEPPAGPKVGETETRGRVEELPALVWGEDYQVRVVGGDPLTRVRFKVFLGDLRDDFRWLLFKLNPMAPQERHRWSVPLRVTLWGGFQDVHQGEDVLTTVELGPEGRFVVKVEVKLHDRFDEDEFRRDFLRALLVEQILAPHAASPASLGQAEVRAPEWLVEGFDRLVVHRRGGSPSSYYRGFLEKGQFMRPAEIFAVADASALDPVRREIFRASASALVEALLGQPEGDESLRAFLGDLGGAAPPPEEVLLRQHFPEFREMDQGLEKWWALELATLSQQHSFEFLTPRETERLLSEALTLHFDAPAEEGEAPQPAKRRGLLDWFKAKPAPAAPAGAYTGPVEDFEAYRSRPETMEKLTLCYDRLQSLKRIGFPLYRPVFAAYEAAITRLARGETKDLAAEFASVAEMRAKIGETLVRVEDSLNHFEAARAPGRSDAFDAYLRLRRELERRPPPKRHDAITRHLDALEWEYR